MLRKLMKLSTIMLVMLLCVSLLFTACGGGGGNAPAPSDDKAPAEDKAAADDGKTYTLKFICSWNKGNINFDRLEVFKAEVERITEGKLIIDIVGGSDVFPASETAEAVMNGVVDGAYTSTGYFSSYVPEADAISASNMTFPEMIESGGYDYFNEILAENNLYGYAFNNEVGFTPFHIFMKTPVKTLADIQGKKIRTSPGFLHEFANRIGATATPLALGEVFSALEQNLIDGYTVPSFIGGPQGFFEYAKYMVYPGFLRPGGTLIFNKKSFDSLPADLQQLLKDNAVAIADAWDEQVDKAAVEENLAMFKEKGGQIVELPEEDAAKFNQAALDVGWEVVRKNVPDRAAKLEELFVKK